jgi:hypothetical protein
MMADFQSLIEPKKPDQKICVVIGGKMYAGKSRFKDNLIKGMQENFGIKFHVSPFAKRLKDLVNDYFGLTQEEADAIKEQIRPDYQWVGTEVMRRQYKQDFWPVIALRHPSKFLVFDDIRYFNELETVQEYSTQVFTVWIDADEDTRKDRCLALGREWVPDSQKHSSELGFTGKEDYWHYVLDNDFKKELYFDDLSSSVLYQIGSSIQSNGFI